MNLTLLLDMIADTVGDRVAVGSRSDGLTYADLRTRANLESLSEGSVWAETREPS